MLDRSRYLSAVASKAGSHLLFALKSLAHVGVLEIINPHVDGFACSSLFEAKLAREIGNRGLSVHLTNPGLRPGEIEDIVDECDYISFNSLTQWFRHRDVARSSLSCGLRINPQLPLVSDDRYNPCRKYSKLGVSLYQFAAAASHNSDLVEGIRGIHFHNNCDSSNLWQLLSTVRRVEKGLGKTMEQLEWINIGGGYLFNEADTLLPFIEAVGFLRSKYGIKVFIEPGAAFVRNAGCLVSSVIDLFHSDGKKVAVLDSTVNHMPELFEYQCQPEIIGANGHGRFVYTLAGGTCLAGDLFGEFAFDEPLEVGSRIVFANVGAYTFVKAHMFNGINLPVIYIRKLDGDLMMQTQFTYEDFASRNGVETHVLV